MEKRRRNKKKRLPARHLVTFCTRVRSGLCSASCKSRTRGGWKRSGSHLSFLLFKEPSKAATKPNLSRLNRQYSSPAPHRWSHYHTTEPAACDKSCSFGSQLGGGGQGGGERGLVWETWFKGPIPFKGGRSAQEAESVFAVHVPLVGSRIWEGLGTCIFRFADLSKPRKRHLKL